MLIIVLPSLQLLNIHNINSKSKDNNLHQCTVEADIPKTSQTRYVAKFKSKKKDLTSKNEFQNVQNKNQTANSTVFLSNKASFKYQVGYSNYNVYGAKNSDFHVTLAKNTTNRIVNIGTNLISTIIIKVTAPGQKWVSLAMTGTFTPTKDMIPASIHYLILGSKNINDASVSLNMVYEKRTDPKTPKTVKIGYFNVNNINANVGTVLSGGEIGGIVVGCVLMVLLAFGCGGIYFLWKRNVVKSATSGIRAIVAASEEEVELSAIRTGRLTYGKGKFFPENYETFVAETNTMIKKADYSKLCGEINCEHTMDEHIGIATNARNKVAISRKEFLDERNGLYGCQELKLESTQEVDELDGNSNPFLSGACYSVLPLDNDSAFNFSMELSEQETNEQLLQDEEAEEANVTAGWFGGATELPNSSTLHE